MYKRGNRIQGLSITPPLKSSYRALQEVKYKENTMNFSTKHFKAEELQCKGTGQVKPNTELLAVLELIRQVFDKPVIITSGYRSPEHNKKVGGAPNSKHIQGIAADIVVKGVEPSSVYDLLDKTFPNYYGLGLYERDYTTGWVHVDVRGDKARWRG